MNFERPENFRGWIPARGYYKDQQAFIDWVFLGKKRLTEPFFDDSLSRQFREPFNLLFRHQTPVEFLGELYETSKGLNPNGFIFHLSRCGSTLVSQMLASLPQNVVVSEASPIDFVLRPKKVPEIERIKWLRWVINALGQKRNREENFFIKFDAWNTLEIDLIKCAFPDVPWIFLYRDPVEVIVSHLRQRGAHMIPGLIKEILPELSCEEALQMPPEEYCASVLEKICSAVLPSLENDEGLAVNYFELPDAVNEKILKHFGAAHSEKDAEKMMSATRFNAKNPHLDFSSDTESKKKEASRAVTKSVEKLVLNAYEKLEKIRKQS